MKYEASESGNNFYIAVAEGAMERAFKTGQHPTESSTILINESIQLIVEFLKEEAAKCPTCSNGCLLCGSTSTEERCERVLGNYMYYSLMYAATAAHFPDLFKEYTSKTAMKAMEEVEKGRKKGFDA